MYEINHSKVTVMTDRGVALSLSYSVLVDEAQAPTRYGVRVAELSTGELAEALDVTSKPERAHELIGQLARNTVTPTTLADVVGDWL